MNFAAMQISAGARSRIGRAQGNYPPTPQGRAVIAGHGSHIPLPAEHNNRESPSPPSHQSHVDEPRTEHGDSSHGHHGDGGDARDSHIPILDYPAMVVRAAVGFSDMD